MPFVRVSFVSPPPPDRRRAVADAVHEALVVSLGVPADDRFQIVETTAEAIYDPTYLGLRRDDGLVMVEIHLSFGRDVAMKKALFAALAARLEAVGVAPRNVFAHLVETARENWSFGEGLAQYADAPPAFLARPA